jgi:AAHS family 4-hydroxybenzoate transporter-like MFS transporter
MGGLLLAWHWAAQSLFLVAALPALCAAVAALALGAVAGRAERT